MTNDPVSDLIVRVMQAGELRRPTVSIPFSNLKLAIAEKLKDAGYVQGVEKKGKKVRKSLDISLKYDDSGVCVIRGVKRVSKPGRRMYTSVREIVPVMRGKGSLVLSTPKGIKTDKEAKQEQVGGEALFEIW